MANSPNDALRTAGKVAAATGVVTALVTAGVQLLQYDSRTTNVHRPRMHELQQAGGMRDDVTLLMDQLLTQPLSHHPFTVATHLFAEADSLVRRGEGGKGEELRGTTVTVHKHIGGKPTEDAVTFQVIATTYDPRTSLKGLALYHLESQTLLFSFPGMDPTIDLPIVEQTICGNILPTQDGTTAFMQKVYDMVADPDKGFPVSRCVMHGNSLGSGTMMFAMHTLFTRPDMHAAFGGNDPLCLLAEGWKARIAAHHVAGEDISRFEMCTHETKCYPGTALAQPENGVLGHTTALLVPEAAHTKGKTSFLGRFLFHSHTIETEDLLHDRIKMVAVEREELNSIGSTHMINFVKRSIEGLHGLHANHHAARAVGRILETAFTMAQNRADRRAATQQAL